MALEGGGDGGMVVMVVWWCKKHSESAMVGAMAEDGV